MRIKSICAVAVALSLMTQIPTFAIEGGSSALGSQYVVPINITTSITSFRICSGAVVTSRVIATAGHCVLDTSELISKQILVGEPGSLNKPMTDWAKVSKVLVDETYRGNTSTGGIGLSDIALLVLEKPLVNVAEIDLASDAVFTSLKNSGSKVRFFGYGFTTDSGTKTDEPKFLDANLTTLDTVDPNSTMISSKLGAACGGDSGAPVLSITPTKVTLLGVLTGGTSATCSRKEPDGNYLAFVTNLSRFSNLVAKALVYSGEVVEAENSSLADAAQQEKQDLQTELNSTIQELVDTREKLNKEIENLVLAISKAGFKVLKCKNKGSLRIVVGKSPTCPKGFKKTL